MRKNLQKFKSFVIKNERILSAGSLVVGFVVDNLTLSRIDRLFENVTLVFYLLLSGVGIVLMGYLKQKESSSTFSKKLALVLPFIVLFSFGGLFSGFTIFYFRSGSFIANWPFMLVIIALFLGTELLKRQYEKRAFQITAFFSGSFLFFIYVLPILTGEMSSRMFIISGLFSLLFIILYLSVASIFIKKELHRISKFLVLGIGTIYVLLHILYFSGVIPPIPLSLKEGEIAHGLTRVGTEYRLTEEHKSGFFSFKKVVHIVKGETLYVFSSVFAPTKIKTNIVHDWQKFDSISGDWIHVASPSFSISGGRGDGYRGYSYFSGTSEGKWRVDVETPRGQVIGRINFQIEEGSILAPLEYINH